MKTTVYLILTLVLFVLVLYEFGREGGALDHALGVTQKEINNESIYQRNTL